MSSEARAPTMLPARILWPHVAREARQNWIMAALTLMTRTDLVSLGVDRTFTEHAQFYSTCIAWQSLPIALRARLLQYLFGEDSKLSVRR